MAHIENTAGRIKQVSFYSFIVFLAISALFAIASVMFGKFGEFEFKALISTSVIALASIGSLCCSAYSSRKRDPLPGISGIVLAAVSALMIILGIWTEMNSADYWKITAVFSFFAVALAHSLALLTVRLRREHGWIQLAAMLDIFALAAFLSIMVLGELGDEGLFKFVAVLAILATLATLVIPILGRLAKSQPRRPSDRLSLTRRKSGLYEDQQGRLYELKELSRKVSGQDNSP